MSGARAVADQREGKPAGEDLRVRVRRIGRDPHRIGADGE